MGFGSVNVGGGGDGSPIDFATLQEVIAGTETAKAVSPYFMGAAKLSDNAFDGLSVPSAYPRGQSSFFSNNPTNKFNNMTYCTIVTIRGHLYNPANPSAMQYAYPYNSDDSIAYRCASLKGGGDVWEPWKTFVDSSNITGSVNGKDMNTVTETGFYYGYTMTNAAETVISTFMVIKYSADWIMQFQHIPGATTKTYQRSRYMGTTWTAWQEIATMTQLASYAEKTKTVGASTDLNTVVVSGFYRLSTPVVNGPSFPADYGQLIVSRGADTITQMVFSYMSPYPMAYRSGNPTNVGGAGSWGAWQELNRLNRDNFAACPASARFSATSALGIKIRLPVLANAAKMLAFTVRLYASYHHTDIAFSGYLYATSNNWYQARAFMIAGSRNIRVVMGKDASGYAYVWIAGPNDYAGVSVLDVTAGYQTQDWNSGWAITQEDITENAILDMTLTAPLPIHAGANTEANKLVRTDANGYIQAGTINSNRPVETPAVGAVFVQNTAADGYLRKVSLANFAQAIMADRFKVQATADFTTSTLTAGQWGGVY